MSHESEFLNQSRSITEKTSKRADNGALSECTRGAALEPVTDADTAPIVAEGTAPPAPFSAIATLERLAKPTEGGL